MVVPIDLAIEPNARARMVQSPNHANAHKRVKDPVDRRAREPREPILHRVVDLVGRRMVVSLQHRLEDLRRWTVSGSPRSRQRASNCRSRALMSSRVTGAEMVHNTIR